MPIAILIPTAGIATEMDRCISQPRIQDPALLIPPAGQPPLHYLLLLHPELNMESETNQFLGELHLLQILQMDSGEFSGVHVRVPEDKGVVRSAIEVPGQDLHEIPTVLIQTAAITNVKSRVMAGGIGVRIL